MWIHRYCHLGDIDICPYWKSYPIWKMRYTKINQESSSVTFIISVAVIINVINIIIFIFMIAILILQLHQNISIFKLVYFVPFRFIRKIMGRGWGIGIAYIRGGWAESFFALCVDLFSRCMRGRQRDISVGGVDNKPKCLIETVLIDLSLSSFF